MRRVVTLLLPALFLLVTASCNKAWRGDGPPGTVAGTVWIGTNEARDEILELSFGMSGDVSFSQEEDGSSTETGEVDILFTSPAAEQGLRDTVCYSGLYTYSRRPSSVVGDVYHGQIRFTLTAQESGKVREAVMEFHNMRFYFEFMDSPGAWPADPAEDSWTNSVR